MLYNSIFEKEHTRSEKTLLKTIGDWCGIQLYTVFVQLRIVTTQYYKTILDTCGYKNCIRWKIKNEKKKD